MKMACNMTTQVQIKRLPHSWLYNRCPESPKFNILQTQKLILPLQVDSLHRTTYFRFFIALNLLYCIFLKFLMVTEEWNPAVRARSWIQLLKKPELANIKLLSLTYYSIYSIATSDNFHHISLLKSCKKSYKKCSYQSL